MREVMKGGVSRRLLSGVVLLVLYLVLDVSVDLGLFQTLDTEVFIVVNSSSLSEGVDSVMVLFSLFGREVVWGLLIFTLFFFGGEREKKVALTLVVLFVLLIGVGQLVKGFNQRLRPYEVLEGVRMLVSKESDYSFPSGHTIIVASGVVVAWSGLKKWFAALLTVEAVLVAFSRVYVGVHYPSDIFGGAFLGAGLGLILCSNPKVVDKIFDRLPKSIRKSLLCFTVDLSK